MTSGWCGHVIETAGARESPAGARVEPPPLRPTLSADSRPPRAHASARYSCSTHKQSTATTAGRSCGVDNLVPAIGDPLAAQSFVPGFRLVGSMAESSRARTVAKRPYFVTPARRTFCDVRVNPRRFSQGNARQASAMTMLRCQAVKECQRYRVWSLPKSCSDCRTTITDTSWCQAGSSG